MEKRSQLLTSILQVAFYLNFLEAFSEGTIQSQYIGCYYDTSSQANWTVGLRVRNSNQMTIRSCLQTCKENKTTFAILQDGRYCLCGDVLNTSVPSNECQILCSGSRTEVCGGSNGTMRFNVIYTACPIGYYGTGCDQVCHCMQYLPCYRLSGKCPNGCESSWTGDNCNKELTVSDRQIGCYGDRAPPNRAMDGYGDYPGANTIEYCSAICASNNTTYVGLQFSSQCFCGESYDRYNTTTNCNMRCSRNFRQTCGGPFANSVYTVCPKRSYGKDCVAQCNCKNTSICPYSTGRCRSGCLTGWYGSSCSDRVCSSQNGACSVNETCVTTNLQFASVSRCQCSPGFQRTSLWDNCADINECILNLCDKRTTTCINKMGSFTCNCQNGYIPGNSRTVCEDINECSHNLCDNRTTTCINTVGSFVCSCINGYRPVNKRNFCEDINECSFGFCDNRTTTCNNTIGSFVCNCRNGYRPGNNRTFCEDINECNLSLCDKRTTTCRNTVGSFVCNCENGYRPGNNRTFCEDINECNLSLCDKQTTTSCINTVGSYVCNCQNGYRHGNNRTFCEDINECNLGLCHIRTTTCVNTVGGFFCICKNGYGRGVNKTFCEDINECNLSLCDKRTTTCINTVGSFVCSCQNGYGRGLNRTSCEDINECNLGLCDMRTTTCINTVGNFVCSCKNGFGRGVNRTFCEDINECNLSPCDNRTTTCGNTVGSFVCSCQSGYRPANNRTFCEDINECNLNLCDNRTTTCMNTVGNFVCSCKNGYRHGVNRTFCEDINECNLSLCDKRTTTCGNTVGSFVCSCQNGYRLGNNRTFCEDINECNLDLCDNRTTTCMNTEANFVCSCQNGYKPGMKRTICEDVDECASMNDTCDKETQHCNNTVGSYVCTCKNGFQMINKSPVNKCEAITDNGKTGAFAGAVVGSVLGLLVIVAIVLLVLFLKRRRLNEKMVNHNQELEDLPSSSQDNLPRDRASSLYAEITKVDIYEEIGPTTGNALNTLHNKLSDPDSIQQEFQSVDFQPNDFCAVGTRNEVKTKNRFINIIPYESNRVVLSRTTGKDTSGYINASYVQGYDNATKFIATQGPRDETLQDFWRMIIENRINLIVMLTKLVESQKKKCEKYWPELGQPVVFGDITVTLTSEKSWSDYTVRCIRCSKKSETVELQQLHYISWPDHDVPSDIKGFLTFYRIVRRLMKPDKYTVVHCSAGAGRTGAFIAIDYLLEQEKVEHDVRILDCLKKLRDQRSQMIQNLAQYLFVHNVLLFAFEIGNTVVPTGQFLSKNKQFQAKDAASGKSTLEKQFQSIEQVQTDPEEADKYRVCSNVIAQNEMNDMNSVFVKNWKLKDAYIATQPADPFTNLWELRREKSCAVMIFLDPTQASEGSYFPTKDNPKTLSDCTLLCESMTKEDYGTRYTVGLSELKELEDTTYANVTSSDIYQNTESILSKTQVTVLHVTKFLGKRSWDANDLMSLYNVVSELTSKRNDVPVMVVSSDWLLSGFCLAAFNAFEIMKEEEMIDIYQIVLNIRKSRIDLFNSVSSYIDLHNVVERYIAKSI